MFTRLWPLNSTQVLKRYILQPLGLACPVNVTHANQDFDTKTTRSFNGFQSLHALVEAKCPSLIGPKAWCKLATRSLISLSHPSAAPLDMPTLYLVNGHVATIFSALADFTKVDKVMFAKSLILRAKEADHSVQFKLRASVPASARWRNPCA